MRHPVEKYNVQQAQVLASLPEGQRAYMARLFRIGNATYCYYHQVKDLSVFDQSDANKPVAASEDLEAWLERQLAPQPESRSARELLQIYFKEYLESLPHDGLRRAEQEGGLDKAKKSFPFRRYVLERHDLGMDEYLRLHLSAEDYAFHRSNAPDNRS